MREVWELIIRRSKETRGDSLYIHFPCFDGLISGVLAWEFLESHEHWTIRDVHPVNYNVRDRWLTTPLETRSAIVDFLYHPQAAFWADHHLTSFVDGVVKKDFDIRKARLPLFYDDHSGSSASLLWNRIAHALDHAERYKEMVDWAEKIDSASYSSVEEAVLGDAPALRINFSLMSHVEIQRIFARTS
jgi:hypothetical protein